MKKGNQLSALCLFTTLLLIIQTEIYPLLTVWAIAAGFRFIDKSMRMFIVTTLVFGFGFFLYGYINTHWIADIKPDEIRIILNRLSLIVILVLLIVISLIYRLPIMHYWQKPKWDEPIHIPFIWAGFRQTKVSSFLYKAMLINLIVFVPFIVNLSWSFFQEIWWFIIIFSILNAALEEYIWRGVLLSRFTESLGSRWAVVTTSIGFGLQHYSLGFSWISCLAFSVGGFFFGALTVQSRSIVPAVIWHILFNGLMVLSGVIVS
ncbi:CPBP family intramembrane metalloprotease [Oceanobacillus piezotolerans]|uniref:CPBP family intramembrane metalloprotease n=2 Tax=Oceanobacillus piezotolerans TaxID=2448030 RepID=A0A498D9A5_9BACI|nr:CPBP family intramembrane metalloprotease [Oceanobacillus piezotolerans]